MYVGERNYEQISAYIESIRREIIKLFHDLRRNSVIEFERDLIEEDNLFSSISLHVIQRHFLKAMSNWGKSNFNCYWVAYVVDRKVWEIIKDIDDVYVPYLQYIEERFYSAVSNLINELTPKDKKN
ncbi:hypothetical protein HF1_02120 [Mycoplasma haemofelis str. Langford 1]|uniref:Uncharacterized protein n=2 Tax=Mycoplasma haemofelis TaxID=29501 RepID=F6FGE6_MYCHI|nr:hypothetical protein [Mycoplasma haemofelis]AEG72536.1 hypothetical protein MHF_0241 [Mycoplasma haemofelis Ohio2]CBY92220.1 hypothetical protein HF1_02120 [Mycoplasma haemofelis str. Langford 1]